MTVLLPTWTCPNPTLTHPLLPPKPVAVERSRARLTSTAPKGTTIRTSRRRRRTTLTPWRVSTRTMRIAGRAFFPLRFSLTSFVDTGRICRIKKMNEVEREATIGARKDEISARELRKQVAQVAKKSGGKADENDSYGEDEEEEEEEKRSTTRSRKLPGKTDKKAQTLEALKKSRAEKGKKKAKKVRSLFLSPSSVPRSSILSPRSPPPTRTTRTPRSRVAARSLLAARTTTARRRTATPSLRRRRRRRNSRRRRRPARSRSRRCSRRRLTSSRRSC